MSKRGENSTETVLKLIELIYRSVTNAACWQVFLDTFVRAVGAQRAAVHLRDTNGADFVVVCWSGWSDEDVRLYFESYAAHDPFHIRSGRWPEGVVGSHLDLCSKAELESSLAFREFYAPRDCINGMGGTILLTAAGQSLITAMRGAKEGPFEEHEQRILRFLMPHLKQAAILHGERASLRSQLSTFTSHLDRYPHALVLTDAQSRILYANSAAHQIAARKDGLVMEQGRLSPTSRRQDDEFRQALSKTASDRKANLLRMEITRPSGRKPFRLMLMPAEDSQAIPLGVSQPTVTILIVDSDAQAEPDLAVLQEMFALTPAEARVVGRLVLGRSVDQIAREWSCSIETVRTHLKHVLSKTETRRQAELISLVLRTAPFRT